MSSGYVVYYQKRNGEIIERFRTSLPDNRIGHHSSMGWLIKDIKYVYDGKTYDTEQEYYKAIKKKYMWRDLKWKISKMLENNVIGQLFVIVSSSMMTAFFITKM